MTVSLPNEYLWFPKVYLGVIILHSLIYLVFAKKNPVLADAAICLSIVVFIATSWYYGLPVYYYNSVQCYAVGILCARNEKLIKKLFDRKYIVALAVLTLIAIMAGLTILPNRPVQLLVAMVMCILIYIISIRKEVSVKLFKQIGDKSFVYYIFHAVMLNCFKVYASLNPMLYCVLVFVSTGVLVSIYYRIEKRLKNPWE